MDIRSCAFFRRSCYLPIVLGGGLIAFPVQAQDRETVDTHLAELDRLIGRLEQQLAREEQTQTSNENLSQRGIPPPPPVVNPDVPIPGPVKKDTCEDSVDELETQYQELQKSYDATNRQITSADERLALMRNRFRESNLECNRRLLSELDEFIQELELMPVQNGLDKVAYTNLCIEQRKRELDIELETASHMRLERLMKGQNQVRQITSGTTDLWYEYDYFVRKQDNLLLEAKEIRQECDS